MPTSASLVTNLPADFNTFGQAVDTSMSELLGGTTGQVLSKTSNTNMDFTWVTPTDQTPLTTKGDLFTFTTVDARLGVGANDTVLTADSSTASGLKWATPASGSTFVGALASTRAALNVNNNTFTAVPLATEEYDTDSIHSTSTNNSRFTIPSGKGGKWLFYGTAGFDSMPAGSIQVRFYKNGASTGQSIFTGYGGSGITSASISVVLTLAAADYVELMVFQNSGGTETLLVSGSEDFTFMGCSYLGA